MTAVSRTTLDSNAHANILAIVDNRSYVVDPKHPSSIEKNRTFVYDCDRLAKALNFGDFPYIILEFPTISQSKVNVDGKHKDVEWTQRITVRAARDGSSNVGGGVGRTDMSSISDDLFETFNSETVKQTLRVLNMFKMSLEKVDVDCISINEKLVYEAQYLLKYMERLKVSG